MTIQAIQDELKSQQLWESLIKKYTLLIDDKSNEQGALFFIPIGKKEIKIVLPTPFHQDILNDKDKITYKNLLSHKQIILLK